MTLLGAPGKSHAVSAFPLIPGCRSLSGSPSAAIAEAQEMLDFCGRHNITADLEVIPIQKVNEAGERMARGDVKYRFPIDLSSARLSPTKQPMTRAKAQRGSRWDLRRSNRSGAGAV